MRTILNTLRIILSIQNTIDVNAILDGIRHIPFIGKYIGEEIHGISVFKILALIPSVIFEILKLFFGKLLMFVFLFFAAGAFSSFNDFSQKSAFLYGYTAISFFAVGITNYFNATTDAEYAVFIMGMDAKKYVETRLFYNIANVVLGYSVFGIPFALLSSVPWYIAILIPVSAVGMRAIKLGLQMTLYAAKQKAGRIMNRKGVPVSIEGNLVVNVIIITVICVALVVAAPFVLMVDMYIPIMIFVIASSLAVIPGVLLIRSFPYGLYRTALFAEKVQKEVRKSESERYKKGNKEVKINKTTEIKTSSKGYEFLNELFFKRHRKILFTRQFWVLCFTVCAIALTSVFLYFEMRELENNAESIVRYIITKHSALFTFILLFTNSGAYMAHAMFANCDSSLLMFSFYRTPEALHKMYRLRVASVIKYNLIPSIMASVYCVVVILITGGEDYFSECIFTVLSILIATVFFSVRHMAIYYLLQPYSRDFMVKSKLYGFFSFIIGFVLFVLIFIPIPAWLLSLAGLIITAIYIVLGDLLVKKFASKTFRLR